jgi:broad specificity phosphatase PhoE
MRIFLIRHADPDYPNDNITPAGHLEAAALAQRMKKLGLDRIYVSPLGRAIATMRYTADLLRMSHTVQPWTAELSQCRLTLEPWGKQCVWDTPGELIREHEPMVSREDWHRHALFRDHPLFLETFQHLQKSSDAFLAQLGYERIGGRYRIVRPNREKIALFCHGGFGLWWLAHLLEIPLPLMWAGFHLPPSSVTTILFDERSDQWATPRCTAVGDTSHLYGAGLPVQPAGIKANRE